MSAGEHRFSPVRFFSGYLAVQPSVHTHCTVKCFASWFAQVGQTLKMAVVQTAYANGSSTRYLEETVQVFLTLYLVVFCKCSCCFYLVLL